MTLTGYAISDAYARTTGVLGSLDGSPEPTCSECGDDLPGAEVDIDEDGRAVLLVCDDCAAVPCVQCRTVLEHPDLVWCSQSCRDEDYREQRAEMAGDL